MQNTEIINIDNKTAEQIRQLQLKEIILSVKPNQFIYNKNHKDFFKPGKRTIFWFQTTTNLNKQFPENKLNREI